MIIVPKLSKFVLLQIFIRVSILLCRVLILIGMHVPPTPTINTEKEPTIDAFNDARTNAQKLEGDQANQRHLICLICIRTLSGVPFGYC